MDILDAHSANTHATRRKIYLFLIFIVSALGLMIHAQSKLYLKSLASYAPDTLWAFLIFSLVVALAPRLPVTKAALIALSYSVFMESAQLYQASWINALRATTVGDLLLGYGFLWSDLACYVAGVALGVAFNRVVTGLLPPQCHK